MTNVRREIILLVSGVAIILSACGDDTKVANAANFETALNAYYLKVKACIPIGGEPNSQGIIQEFRSGGGGANAQLQFYNGMTSLGLLEEVTYQKHTRNFSGEVSGKSDWVGFKFSEEGKVYLKTPTDPHSTGVLQLCYGTPQVVAITGFTEPVESMGVKTSNVQYTYKHVDIAPWAGSKTLSGQYPWLSNKLSDQNIQFNDDMVLMESGWTHHKVVQ